MQATIIQAAIEKGIRENPEAAAREVPEIVGHYITDNTRLNRVYRAAKNVVDSPTQTTLAALAWAVGDAEGVTLEQAQKLHEEAVALAERIDRLPEPVRVKKLETVANECKKFFREKFHNVADIVSALDAMEAPDA